MIVDRRRFLAQCLALGAAPYVSRLPGALMRGKPRPRLRQLDSGLVTIHYAYGSTCEKVPVQVFRHGSLLDSLLTTHLAEGTDYSVDRESGIITFGMSLVQDGDNRWEGP